MSSTKTEKSYRVIYNPNYCKFATCEICIGLCPVKNLVIKDNKVTDLGLCKGCMLCQYVCKYDVFEPGQERSALDYLMPRPSRPENCRLCRLCESHCPDMALVVVAPQGPGKGKGKK